jgi:non-ribosomal peptide synthetase component F
VQTYRGDRHWFGLAAEPTGRLRALARESGGTLFMALLASFAVLLRRRGGQDDVVIGTHVAGRGRVEVERVIGFFVNNLVLRLDLSGDPSFRELLRRAREVCLGAYMHQDVPFVSLVQAIRPERDPSRTPLFQVLLVLQNAPAEAVGVEGARLRPLSFEAPIAKFDLTLFVYERGTELTAYIEHNTDLFERATVERLAVQLQETIGNLVSAPEAPLSALAFAADAKTESLLQSFTADLEDLG